MAIPITQQELDLNLPTVCFFSKSADAVIGRGKNEHAVEELTGFPLPSHFRKMLSNFYPARVSFVNAEYPSVEHAFHAAKFLQCGHLDRAKELEVGGSYAEQWGNNIKNLTSRKNLHMTSGQVDDWNRVSNHILFTLWTSKFSNPEFSSVLMATGNARLVHFRGRSGGHERWIGLEEIRHKLKV